MRLPATQRLDVTVTRAMKKGITYTPFLSIMNLYNAHNVFMYDFNMPWSIAPDLLRAGHASEISHVFGLPYLPMPDAESQAVAGADLVGEEKRAAHKDGDDESGDKAESEDCLFHGNQSSLEGKVRSVAEV